jgi:hypothetical protein
MTDFAADSANSTAGGLLTPRTGTASGDTVPAGVEIVAVAAGNLTITLTNALTNDGLAVANKTHVLTTGQVKKFLTNPAWGDANGRIPFAVTSGTPSQLTYYVSN